MTRSKVSAKTSKDHAANQNKRMWDRTSSRNALYCRVRHCACDALPEREEKRGSLRAVKLGGKTFLEIAMGLILLIIVVLLLLGAIPSWPYSRGWGYGPSGGLGLVLVIVVVLLLMGRI